MKKYYFVLALILILFSARAQYVYSYKWSPSPNEYFKENKKDILNYDEYSKLAKRDEVVFVATINVTTKEIMKVEYSPIESEIQKHEYGSDLDPETVKKIANNLQQNIKITKFNTAEINQDSVILTMRLFFDKKDRKAKPW